MIGAAIVLKTMIKGSKTYDTFSKIKITIPKYTSAINEKTKSFPPKYFIYRDSVNFKIFLYSFHFHSIIDSPPLKIFIRCCIKTVHLCKITNINDTIQIPFTVTKCPCNTLNLGLINPFFKMMNV